MFLMDEKHLDVSTRVGSFAEARSVLPFGVPRRGDTRAYNAHKFPGRPCFSLVF